MLIKCQFFFFSGGILGNPRTKEPMVNLAKRPVPEALDLP
jgi:hypothetical protein